MFRNILKYSKTFQNIFNIIYEIPHNSINAIQNIINYPRTFLKNLETRLFLNILEILERYRSFYNFIVAYFKTFWYILDVSQNILKKFRN